VKIWLVSEFEDYCISVVAVRTLYLRPVTFQNHRRKGTSAVESRYQARDTGD
jgi:hypothetical protein